MTRGSTITTSGPFSAHSAFRSPCTAWHAPLTRPCHSPRSSGFRSRPSWPRRVSPTRLSSGQSGSTLPHQVRSVRRSLRLSPRARAAVGADAIDGIIIQPMITGGVETLIGITHDPLFGPLVGFGIGGINVEVPSDVRFRMAPLTDRDADDLLHEIRGFPLLAGHRGHPAADIEALRDVLLRISSLAEHVPEIAELDLNPVIALPPGRRLPGASMRASGSRRRVVREPRLPDIRQVGPNWRRSYASVRTQPVARVTARHVPLRPTK